MKSHRNVQSRPESLPYADSFQGHVFNTDAEAIFAMAYGYLPDADDPKLDSEEFERVLNCIQPVDKEGIEPVPELTEKILKAIPCGSIVFAILTTK
jgi:hypothetical protein